jgi:hypothetical protein
MRKLSFAVIPLLLIAITVISTETFTTQTAHAGANGSPVFHVTVNEPNIQAVKLSFKDINGNIVSPCVLLEVKSRPDTEINYYIQPDTKQHIIISAYVSPIDQLHPCDGLEDQLYHREGDVDGLSDVTVVI